MKRILMVLSLMVAPVAGADTLVRCAQLIDGISDRAMENMTVRVANGRIQAVESNIPPGTDDTVIDIDGTCMPGLMDMHVHIASRQSPDRFEEQFRLDPMDYALRAVPFAERTLMAGFTTVRDLGTSHGLALSIRDAIAQGYIKGPRIYAAGKSLATTGGHADPTNGRNEELLGDPGPKQGVVNQCRGHKKGRSASATRKALDLIKITATGGVLSQASSGENPQFTDEELEALMKIAGDYNFKVAAHAHGAEGMKRAVRAGIDSIEHGTYMDEEIMRLMKKHDTAYVPTIIAGKFVAEKAEEEGYFSDVVRPKAKAIGPLIQDTFNRAWRAGVKIVFGTDSGVSPHGDNWKEFVYMVDDGGMPAMDAIQSATMGGARLMDIADELGSIETGKIADLVACRR
ncbi:MAG: amidohydrolase family protein [Gammaproteobacteria bacterium]|nr:amidohydrolase family protein [Gammaproteobacteria bacterium]